MKNPASHPMFHFLGSNGRTACGLRIRASRKLADGRPADLCYVSLDTKVECWRCQNTQAFKAAATERALLGNPSWER